MITVSLLTNRPEFQNDIAEVIRAYLGFAEIALQEEESAAFQLRVDVHAGEQNSWAHAKILQAGKVVFSCDHPVKGTGEKALIIKREEKRAVKIAVFRALRSLYPQKSVPWGSLTGIRPTKLFRELMEERGAEETCRLFVEEFDVLPQKAALAREIVEVQSSILRGVHAKSVDVYIGIPFCRTRCLYCSFASQLAGKNGVPEEYLAALFADISLGARIVQEGGYQLRSMYVGGGTPTVLQTGQLARLLEHALHSYGGYGTELTVEAGRPDTVDEEKLRAIKALGVGRISLNPQTMNGKTLQLVGRAHTPEDIVSSFDLARRIGFDNINMDTIIGLPGEGMEDVCNTLLAIEKMGPESLTVHTLAVKRSSELKGKLQAYPLPESEAVDAMLRMCAERAAGMGMRPYYMYRQKYMRGNLENVGYAKAGKECVYNIDMMEEAASIMAHGAGAMSKRVFEGRDMRVERIPAPKDIRTYIEKNQKLSEQKRLLYLEGGLSLTGV